ncbi:MAG: hypothetical protein ACT4P7_14150 [Gemmatimonadaceae bacterium]
MNRRRYLAVLLALSAAACGGARQGSAGTAQPTTTVRVENQSYLDMVIYLIAGSQRIRLGTAGGNSTTTLRIPQQYVFGVSSLQFLADPIGSNRTPISDTIAVSPGDQVRLMIPPT